MVTQKKKKSCNGDINGDTCFFVFRMKYPSPLIFLGEHKREGVPEPLVRSNSGKKASVFVPILPSSKTERGQQMCSCGHTEEGLKFLAGDKVKSVYSSDIFQIDGHSTL